MLEWNLKISVCQSCFWKAVSVIPPSPILLILKLPPLPCCSPENEMCYAVFYRSFQTLPFSLWPIQFQLESDVIHINALDNQCIATSFKLFHDANQTLKHSGTSPPTDNTVFHFITDATFQYFTTLFYPFEASINKNKTRCTNLSCKVWKFPA